MSRLSTLPKTTPNILYNFKQGNLPPAMTVVRNQAVLIEGPNKLLRSVPANTPCIEYRDGNRIGMYVGGESSNLLKYSDFRTGFAASTSAKDIWWNSAGIESTPLNPIKAPTGNDDGVALLKVAPAAGNYNYIRHYPNITLAYGANDVYCSSVYVKAGTSNVVSMLMASGVGAVYYVYAQFNLTGEGSVRTWSKTTNTANYAFGIERVCGDWYRVFVRTGFDATSGAENAINIVIYPGIHSAQVAGDSVYCWGVQLEKSQVPNSLAMTNGTAVTGVIDLIKMDIPTNCKTMMINARVPHRAAHPAERSLLAYGTSAEQFRIYSGINYTTGGSNLDRIRSRVNSADIYYNGVATNGNNQVKVAGSIGPAGTVMSSSGVGLSNSTPSSLPALWNSLFIGSWLGVSNISLNGCVESIALYDQEMTLAQLNAMTKN